MTTPPQPPSPPSITPEELARLKELYEKSALDVGDPGFRLQSNNPDKVLLYLSIVSAAPALLRAAEAYSELVANGWRVYRSLRGVSVPEPRPKPLEI